MWSMHDQLWRNRNMIFSTDIPDELWDELKEKLEKTAGGPWTDKHVQGFLQTILIEHIIITIEE